MRVASVFSPVEAYADAGSSKTHAVVALVSFCVFVGTIALGFVPVTRRIESSGYSTAELQEATSRAEVDTILQAFEPVMDAVVLLSALDYLFIVAGFFLFFSLHSIVMKQLSFDDRLVLIPKIGMVLTVVSRLLDSLENLWVILLYTNPERYPTVLIPVLNTTQSAKWLVVGVEYSTLGLGLVLVLLVWVRQNVGSSTAEP